MTDTEHPYLDAFPPSQVGVWRERVSTVLKGKGADTLVSRTHDGVAIEPLYPPNAERMPIARQGRTWSVLARVDAPDAGAANAQALEDLGNGADGLHLVFAGGVGDYCSSLQTASLARALTGVVLDAEIAVEVDSLDGLAAADALAAAVEAGGADPAATRIAFGVDPFGALARGIAADAPAPSAVERAKMLAAKGFAGPFFVADARLVHAAGGSEAQELGYALAAALACLRDLEAGGMPLDEARARVSFRLAVDADEFLGIAKLRALRKLWASVEEGCGLSPEPAHLHAETAWRMTTRRDPDVNMLRTTLAVFAAAVGGADRVTVLPHTQALGVPDAFARRVARNSQLVLREEASVAKVADPAAGSGGLEALTDMLCERGWQVFQSLEAAGGLGKALAGSAFREEIARVADARRRAVARRADGITGVSEFPHLGEPLLQTASHPTADRGTAFAPHRLAEPFEALRDRSDEHLRHTGSRPRVYLATLGSAAAFTPRLSFAKNLFEAGGFETVAHEGADTPEALAEGLRRSEARVACLCSSDAIYAERAASAAAALAPLVTRLVLAGRPGSAEEALRDAGVTDFAFVGVDVLALLETLAQTGYAHDIG